MSPDLTYAEELDIMFAPGREYCDPWVEASVIREPLKTKDLKQSGPMALVQRNRCQIIGTNNEDFITVPGLPTISLFTGCGGNGPRT